LVWELAQNFRRQGHHRRTSTTQEAPHSNTLHYDNVTLETPGTYQAFVGAHGRHDLSM